MNIDTIIEEAFSGDFDLFEEYSRLFLKNCPEYLKNIEHALQSKDATALEESAHRLRGSLLTYSERSIISVVEQLEHFGHQKDLNTCTIVYDRLFQQVNNLCAQLKKFLKERKVA